MELTEDDVLQIIKLLNESNFGHLHLEIGDMKLTVSRHGAVSEVQYEPAALATGKPTKNTIPIKKTEPAPAVPAANKEAASVDSGTSQENGLTPIKAPMLGIFYNRPELGKPPYVEVGKYVQPEDTVGLIEVMKLFNPVKAGVKGRVSKICVTSGQLVEYKQDLFLVKAD